MKKVTLLLFAAIFLFAACNSDKKTEDKSSTTNEAKTDESAMKKPPPAEVDSATMQKNWEEYMTPGDMHKMMANWDGNWEGEVTFWMPGAPEQKSKSSTVNKMVMNGLYQESEHTGTMMGMPFNGKSTLAYDNHRKEFVNTWIDNMGSGIMVLKGPWDASTKTITLKGRMVDPGTKGDCDVRQTFQIVDDNTQVMEMFGPDPKTGNEIKTMNIKFTRKK